MTETLTVMTMTTRTAKMTVTMMTTMMTMKTRRLSRTGAKMTASKTVVFLKQHESQVEQVQTTAMTRGMTLPTNHHSEFLK